MATKEIRVCPRLGGANLQAHPVIELNKSGRIRASDFRQKPSPPNNGSGEIRKQIGGTRWVDMVIEHRQTKINHTSISGGMRKKKHSNMGKEVGITSRSPSHNTFPYSCCRFRHGYIRLNLGCASCRPWILKYTYHRNDQ